MEMPRRKIAMCVRYVRCVMAKKVRTAASAGVFTQPIYYGKLNAGQPNYKADPGTRAGTPNGRSGSGPPTRGLA